MLAWDLLSDGVWEAELMAVPQAAPFFGCSTRTLEDGVSGVRAGGPTEAGVLGGRTLMLFALAKEPQEAQESVLCVCKGRVSCCSDHRGGYCKKCFLYVETWQQKLPVCSATCCAASLGWGGSRKLPSSPWLNRELCVPTQLGLI